MASAQALWGILLSDAESDKGRSSNSEIRIGKGDPQTWPCHVAIGNGHVPTPADIAEMHVHILSCLTAFAGPDSANIRIFYGASITLDNVAANLGLRAVGGV